MGNVKMDQMILLVITALLCHKVLPTSTCESAEIPVSSETNHFVLVHGAFHGAWCWYKVVTLLEERGFTAKAIDLSSAGRDKTRADNITSYAEWIKPVIDYLENNVTGQVGHSLGGKCISYAMEQKPEKIAKGVFLSAEMPGVDPASRNTSGNSSKEIAAILIRVYGNGTSNPPTSFAPNLSNRTLLRLAYYGRSPEQDITLASTLLTPIPYAANFAYLNLTRQRYGSIRRFYIKSGEDLPGKRGLSDSIISANPPEKVYEILGSDHSPFFSKPEELTDLLERINSLHRSEFILPGKLPFPGKTSFSQILLDA